MQPCNQQGLQQGCPPTFPLCPSSDTAEMWVGSHVTSRACSKVAHPHFRCVRARHLQISDQTTHIWWRAPPLSGFEVAWPQASHPYKKRCVHHWMGKCLSGSNAFRKDMREPSCSSAFWPCPCMHTSGAALAVGLSLAGTRHFVARAEDSNDSSRARAL